MEQFQVTTGAPQFEGQEQRLDRLGRPIYVATYESLLAAKLAARGQTHARIWAYLKGIDGSGHLVLERWPAKR